MRGLGRAHSSRREARQRARVVALVDLRLGSYEALQDLVGRLETGNNRVLRAASDRDQLRRNTPRQRLEVSVARDEVAECWA